MGQPTLLAARVLILEGGEVVDVLVDDDPQVARSLVRRDVGGGEALCHVGVWEEGGRRGCGVKGRECFWGDYKRASIVSGCFHMQATTPRHGESGEAFRR